MKRSTTLLAISSSIILGTFLVYGCGDDDDAVTTTTTPKADSGTSGTSGGTSGNPGVDSGPTHPAPPALGAQIDRFGRPAINTAANNTFNADDTAHGAAQDSYNADKTATGWKAKYTAEAAKNLAIYDGLDAVCGNQPFVDNDAGIQTSAGRYGTLGGVLADDRQFLNTAGTTCGAYLAVELNATKVLVNNDCGGRTLKYDVIDVTYNLVAGTLKLDADAPGPVHDGISAVPAKTNGTVFPYLAAPTP